ncbi:glucose uptake protein glcu [Limosilactobacillus panis DSM 6035]|uniref:Glucose uptake protein glcu n=1 Tax=Limosilactobacillus panis DSM 6035 TaxID=1423782 RepID=A0A0R1XUW2_9LACO|nr:glucose uptake protein glcu [Limosilactobacillus panis DSM 6035]
MVPAVGWGIMPLITGKVGGSTVNQTFGIGAGATIIGLLAFAIAHLTGNPGAVVVSARGFWISVLCGALWSTGQIGQFVSFKRMGVSNTIPLSTVFQLIGNSLIGVIIFGEWHTATARLIGFGALVIVIIGALMTSVTDQSSGKKITIQNFFFLLITTFGYWVYSAFPKIPWLANEKSLGIFLPEMLGILLGSVIYTIASGNISAFKQREQYLNIFGGLSWGIAALAYIFAGRALGVNVAFVFTQLNVVIATIGGVFVLHEQKTHREMGFTIAGIIFIVAGSILTAFAH